MGHSASTLSIKQNSLAGSWQLVPTFFGVQPRIMRSFAVTISALIAVTANLLLPQQIVRYCACRCDEPSKVALHPCCQPRHCHAAAHPPRRPCCDPVVVTLKITSDIKCASATSLPRFDSQSEFQQEAPCLVMLALHETPLNRTIWDTGPPQPVDLLNLHSRLNC